MTQIENFAILVISLSAPLILGAMGGFTSERGGVINIGLEGVMLMGACCAGLGSLAWGAVPGLLIGLAGAVALSLLHWLLTQKFRMDHVVSGMAINALALGGTNYLWGKFSDPRHVGGMPHISVGAFWVVGLALPFLLAAYVRHTRGGLRLLAVGSDPAKARLVGVRPQLVRFVGLLATGVFAGLGGIMLVSDTELFTDNMTAGRGYIALAALIIGGWRPVPAMLACLGFGFFSALRIELQGTSVFGGQLPPEAWQALPYLVTIVALAGFLGKNRTPAGLGKL